MKRAVLFSAIVIIGISVVGVVLLRASAKPFAPKQPIEFDHWQHVTKNDGPQLECTFCHENVDKSSHATIPNITTCMGCHDSIKTDSAEVQKLAAFAEQNQQPLWRRVYWLEPEADAFYTHKPHIRAGLECATCHGKIAEMHRVRREVDQSMGWCIDCHRARSVSIDCYICHR
jgi:Cytochrome c7 and related cytochrome c/Class III cytochrome C family